MRLLAATLGADCPFFLASGPQFGTGDGSELAPLQLPQDYWVLLVLPEGARKQSTAEVYRRFDERGGELGFEERRARLAGAPASVSHAGDLAALPRNDLASSPLATELLGLGAFRADVSGAGPTVFASSSTTGRPEAARRTPGPRTRLVDGSGVVGLTRWPRCG